MFEKVKAQATDDIYEPDDPDNDAAGKKWAKKFNEEDRKRREERERERQDEIAQAKENYIEHASEAVYIALSKEEQQLKEEERLRAIEEHQKELRKQNNLGGIALVEGEGDESTATDDMSKSNAGHQDNPDYESSEVTASSEGRSLPLIAQSDLGTDNDRDDGDGHEEDPETVVAAPQTKPKKQDSAPAKQGRTKRGNVPDTNGLVIPYEDLKNNASR